MVPAIPLVRAGAEAERVWSRIEAVERPAAAVALLMVSPILIAAAVVVWVLSRRRPLIAHLRVGCHGSPLWTYKLRTMWPAAAPGRCRGLVEYLDGESGTALKSAGDPRVTSAFARFCRRYSIDELPQLIHIAAGRMSFVGPRPLTAAELNAHYGDARGEVLSVTPGLTGLWQCSGRGRLNYAERRALDLEYVRTRSPQLYLRILARTVPAVFRGADAW